MAPQQQKGRRYFIKTFGCQMNENDSEILAGILESKGYSPAPDVKDADVVLTNTCSVRDGAERKANGFIHYLNKLKKGKENLTIGVVGCMAERMGEEILKKFKFVDFVLGPREEEKLEELLPSPDETRDQIRDMKRKPQTNAWITIMEGCDNYCSYCIVPYVRGREKSRPVDDILKEIDSIDKNIFKEVTLLGQNVNSYEYDFAKLLKEVSRINGIMRVRFMTSHPKDMNDEIIDAVAQDPKICEYFHLPLQSGDDEILQKMNRGYTKDYYINLINKIRSKMPNVAITSDVIVGFPGESDEQFQNTIDLISQIEFDSVNTLSFDPRPQTRAYNMENRVSQDIISNRLKVLMNKVEEIACKINQRLVNTNQEILVEKNGLGRMRSNKIVKFHSDKDLTGQLINVKIISAGSWILQGSLIS